MPYVYKYLGDDQDLTIESDERRPDLMEWAYWSETEAQAKPKPEPKPEPEKPAEPAKKAAPRKATARKPEVSE